MTRIHLVENDIQSRVASTIDQLQDLVEILAEEKRYIVFEFTVSSWLKLPIKES